MLQEEVKNECIAKWSENRKLDKRLKNFCDIYDKWVNQIPEEYNAIILRLLIETDYYTRIKTNHIITTLHQKLLSLGSVTINNTIYAYIKSKDGESNSSNDYWTEYKEINRLSKYVCIENLNALPQSAWDEIENIVFIDDFSGSGDSIIEEFKKHLSHLGGKTIYVITICLMNDAKENLTKFGSENNFEVVCICDKIYYKAFEQDFFENNDECRQKYLSFAKLKKIGWKLGYRESESLIVFYNNTPNNSLGFIHNESKKYFPIFKRNEDEKPNWQKNRVSK